MPACSYRLLILLIFFIHHLEQKILANPTSLSDLELSKIVDHQNRLFKEGSSWTEKELTRQAQEIVNLYESYLLENSNNTNALILFGKFLRKTGQNEDALALFLRADQANPNIAVVKQELGNYLVENNQPMEAFPFFLMATRLDPNEPFYHYNLGNFVFLFEEHLTKLNKGEKMGLLMHESFKEAARLQPANFDYQLRYAQSFFDFNSSDKADALIAWNILIKEFGKRSEIEIDYLKLGKARVLIDLKRQDEAITLLHSVKSASVIRQRTDLFKKALIKKKLPPSDVDKHKFDTKENQHPPTLKSGYLKTVPFVTDPLLENIKRITKQLLEDSMLEDFRRDVRIAKFLSNGELSLEMSFRDQGSDHSIEP